MKRLLLLFLTVACAGSWWIGTDASSHREAPLISADPLADNTDVYAFVSPDRPDTVTIIANYIPLEEPAGGPNFHSFDDNVLYEIHVDNDGNGRDDVTFQFRFRTKIRNPNTFLYNTGPIDSLSDTDWNMPQTYRVRQITNRQRTTIGRNLPTAPANIGPRSTPAYEALRAEAVQILPNGIKVFAGPADDPFFVDLGSVFDLAGLRPFNPLHAIPLLTAAGVDGVGGFNTHAIAIQVPITQLTRNRQLPSGPTDPNAVLGIYASASRPRVWVDEDHHDDDEDRDDERQYVQVSRLGNPLINEVVIPLGQKDRWNRSDPDDDARFLIRYTSPEVTRLENALYAALDDAPETQRGDLVAVLLTGVPGLNFTGSTRADLLRLNVAIPPSGPVGTGDRLGVLNGDFAGFPNGRRLEDDVTDIDLRAFACGYGSVVGPIIESFGFCGGNANRSPNNLLGDGVDVNDRVFSADFPYVAIPHQGYEHAHHP
ncbi:MAG TPA: DUF4331 domain-containing protein [Vicinamibacterales bacterium]